MGLSSCCGVNSTLLKAVKGWGVFSYSYGVWNSIQANESKAAGMKFACLRNLSSAAVSRSECTLSKGICFGGTCLKCQVNDYCLGTTSNHPHSIAATPELHEIHFNSNSDSIWLGPRRCEGLRASLSARNCQQHERSPRIHVELYGLIHERLRQWCSWGLRTEQGKSFSFLRFHHAPHTNEKFRVRFSSSLFCSNGNAIEAFKGFAPFRMEAGRQGGERTRWWWLWGRGRSSKNSIS